MVGHGRTGHLEGPPAAVHAAVPPTAAAAAPPTPPPPKPQPTALALLGSGLPSLQLCPAPRPFLCQYTAASGTPRPCTEACRRSCTRCAAKFCRKKPKHGEPKGGGEKDLHTAKGCKNTIFFPFSSFQPFSTIFCGHLKKLQKNAFPENETQRRKIIIRILILMKPASYSKKNAPDP